MNFLTICKETAKLAGIGDDVPSTVVGQTGEPLRLVNWVNQAWREIQQEDEKDWRKYWKWMVATDSQAVTTQTYTPAATTQFPIESTFKIYLTADGSDNSEKLTWMDWLEFYDTYDHLTDTGPPEIITREPGGDYKLYPNPNGTSYTVTNQFVSNPTQMSGNADIPEMPESYHYLIVYRATQMWAKWMENLSTYQTAGESAQKQMNHLKTEQLTVAYPEVTVE